MQFAENFHQSKPEPVAFARAARRIMAEDESLTAAEVSRLVGAPASWTRKALRLLELPESIVERVEAGDLSFTSADLVRRGIARGDVSADDAAVAGRAALGRGAERRGFEARRGLRPAAARELRRALARAGRGALPPGARSRRPQRRRRLRLHARRRAPESRPARGRGRRTPAPRRLVAEELDAYLLGVFLARAASDHRRAVLRIHSEADAHTYALSLRPTERLAALRSLAAEVIADDPTAPAVYRARRLSAL